MNDKPGHVKAGRKGKTQHERELNQDPRRLRRRRVASGMSITDLAARAGCSVPYLWQLENGDYSASAPMLAKLAKALGCEITDLMPREPNGAAA